MHSYTQGQGYGKEIPQGLIFGASLNMFGYTFERIPVKFEQMKSIIALKFMAENGAVVKKAIVDRSLQSVKQKCVALLVYDSEILSRPNFKTIQRTITLKIVAKNFLPRCTVNPRV